MGARFRVVWMTASVVLVPSTALFGQSVISARSGLIHYVEGQVTVDGKTVELKYSQFPDVRDGQVLKTEEGRAEVLLTPGVFLRVAENSSFRMVSNRLSDTKVEALGGALMVEHGEIVKENQVTLLYKDRTISFLKSGLYRIDAENGQLKVYQGEARVVAPEQSLSVKAAHEIQLEAAVLTAMKFDAKLDDEFYRWASRRASYIAMANVSAAKRIYDSGFYNSSRTGLWSWNPWFGMFTYVPFGNMWYSPFGYGFYTPSLINQFYAYYPGYYGAGHGYGSGYYGGGGGGSSSATRGRFNSASSYSTPSRPSGAAGMGANPGVSAGSGGGRAYGGGGGMTSGGGFSGGGGHGGGGGGGFSSGGGGAGGRAGGGGGGGGARGH